jgi:membrane protein YqaA with SNARE-associated domain
MGNLFIKTISIVVTVVVLVAFTLSVIYQDMIREMFAAIAEEHGQMAVFAGVFFLEAIPQPLTPDFIVITAFLVGLSPTFTISVAVLASIISSVVTYEIGRQHGPRRVKKNFNGKRAKKFLKMVRRHGRWAIFLAAVSPLPYIPIIIGALDFSRITFISFGLIPRALGMVARAYILYIVFV